MAEEVDSLRVRQIVGNEFSTMFPADMVVAEALPFAVPIKLDPDVAPSWLLGAVPYNNLSLPIISIDLMLNPKASERYHRLVIVKSLGDHPGLPAYMVAARENASQMVLTADMLKDASECDITGVAGICSCDGFPVVLLDSDDLELILLQCIRLIGE